MSLSGLFAPRYYGEFECIKGECRHSCCIGWEIDIDGATMAKYSALGGEIGERIRKSIIRGAGSDDFAESESATDLSEITSCYTENEYEALPHFVLVGGERCPHLDECGLCRIITELGDGYLSDICRLHPRFFNDTARGREVGLGMSCEEACRIILSSDGYAKLVKIGEDECESCDFDATAYRDGVYAILRDREVPYVERLSHIADSFSVSPSVLSDGEWRDVLSSLEFLDGGAADRFSHYSSELFSCEWDVMLERALAYFVYRHASGAKSYFEFRTGLGFALFCERLLASLAVAEEIRDKAELFALARVISEEIEYSSDNTDAIRAEIEFAL